MNTKINTVNTKLQKRQFRAKLITTMLVVYFFVVLDFLNLESYTSMMSQDVSTRLFSYFYPRTPDDIIVVNTNEKSVSQWPPSYRDYAQWVEFISDYSPKAIFFDINFHVRNNQLFKDEFIDTLKYAKQKNIKLYGIDYETSDKEINRFFTPVSISWEMEDGFYPVIGTSGRTMAAFAIYNDLYNANDDSYSTPMFIKWPSRPPKNELNWFSKFYRGMQSTFSLYTDNYDDKPYLDKFTMHEMFVNSNMAEKKFTGRIVFIGNEREADKDFFENTIYGQVPGVFIHAMALDNLIKYNDNYIKRDASKPILFKLGSGGLIEIIVLFINLFLFIKFDFTSGDVEKKQHIQKALKHSFFLMIVCFLLIIFGIFISHIILRNDPGNIIGLFTTNLFFYETMYYLILFSMYYKFKIKTKGSQK